MMCSWQLRDDTCSEDADLTRKWVETVVNPNGWKHLLSPLLFQSTNKLQRIFQSCEQVKKGKEEYSREKNPHSSSIFLCMLYIYVHMMLKLQTVLC